MIRLALALAVLASPGCAQSWNDAPPHGAAFGQAPAFAGQTRAPELDKRPLVTATVAVPGLEHPWGMAQLPDGGWLVTERPGRMRHVSAEGALSAPLTGLPEVAAVNQGGMLDVALAPDFATSGRIVWSFSEATKDGPTGTAVAEGRLDLAAGTVAGARVIWRETPARWSDAHFGGRLVFAPDGALFVTTGDRNLPDSRPDAQDPETGNGKVIRIAPDGTAAVHALGFRNIQAAAIGPDGGLWTVEHGPAGGDELNRVEAGRNYGWPVITYGTDYDGSRMGEGTAKEGMEQPVYYWDPVIAPSGAVFYDGAMFPEWQGDLLIGALREQTLVRLRLEDGRVTGEQRYLRGEGRIRDVAVAQDGAIWLAIDAPDGALVRVSRP